MDVISVECADRVLKYTSGRLPPLTELQQLTQPINYVRVGRVSPDVTSGTIY